MAAGRMCCLLRSTYSTRCNGVGGVDVGRGLTALRYPADGVIEAGGRWRGAAGALRLGGPCAQAGIALDRLADQALGATDSCG
jgi:hypothetical protein